MYFLEIFFHITEIFHVIFGINKYNSKWFYIKCNITLSNPHSVPSTGGPFFVMQYIDEFSWPHHKWVQDSIRGKLLQEKYLKTKNIINNQKYLD